MEMERNEVINLLEELVFINKYQSEYFLWYYKRSKNLFIRSLLKKFSEQRIRFSEELERFLEKEQRSDSYRYVIPNSFFWGLKHRNELSCFKNICKERQDNVLKFYSKKLARVNKANVREMLLRHMHLIKKEAKSLEVIDRYVLA